MEQFGSWDAPVVSNKTITPETMNMNPYGNIDMECDYVDDTDTFVLKDDTPSWSKEKEPVLDDSYIDQHVGYCADFSDDDDDEIITEAKDGVPTGNYENDFVPDGVKKPSHNNHSLPLNIKNVPDYGKNVKTSHGTVHYRGPYNGNPAREADLLNAELAGGSATGGASAASASASAGGGDGGCACGESVKKNNYTKLCEDLLFVTGFDLKKNPDKTFTLSDTFNDNSCTECADMPAVFEILKPYISDFYICPLQQQTGENFETCDDWCKWYKENYLNFPKYKNDIDVCDLVANHINDIKW